MVYEKEKRIIDTIVDEYKNYKGIDEIFRGLRIALKVSDVKYDQDLWNYLLTEILYKLS